MFAIGYSNKLKRDAFIERNCPICNASFIVQDADWVYKKSDKAAHIVYFCSWKCIRKAEKQSAEAKKQHFLDHVRLDNKTIDLILSMIDAGCTKAEIMRATNVSWSTVDHYREIAQKLNAKKKRGDKNA